MGFFAWIRKAQNALHECAESIHNTEERKKEQCLPSDKPVEVRVVVSYDENTVADAKTQAKREHATQESIEKATWCAFVAVSVYAFITLLMWCQMMKQTKEMHEGGVDTHKLATAALAANRAWLAPEQMTLGSPVESGVPLKYQIRIVNPGKEPALSVAWNVKPYGVPYIPERDTVDLISLSPNTSCSGLNPGPVDGLVLYPSGPMNFWLPLSVGDTLENRQLLNEVIKREKSLVVEGCFAYKADGERHTSSFRFFLRDISGPSLIKDKNGNPIPAWNFNMTLTGNAAN